MTCSRGSYVDTNTLYSTMTYVYSIVICRETRRERILENLKKTWKIREKQLKMIGSIDIYQENLRYLTYLLIKST